MPNPNWNKGLWPVPKAKKEVNSAPPAQKLTPKQVCDSVLFRVRDSGWCSLKQKELLELHGRWSEVKDMPLLKVEGQGDFKRFRKPRRACSSEDGVGI